MEFVVGHSIACEIVRTRRSFTIETIVRRRTAVTGDGRWQPPLAQQWVTIPGSNRITSKHHRRLYKQFLAHCLASDARVHFISGQLAAVREASGGRYIDAYALTLCVAIESLLYTECRDVRTSLPSEKNVESLVAHVNQWRGPEDLKARVSGATMQLRQRRAGDILRALIRKRAITRDQYAAWQELRNRSAHQYQAHGKTSQRLRELLPVVQ